MPIGMCLAPHKCGACREARDVVDEGLHRCPGKRRKTTAMGVETILLDPFARQRIEQSEKLLPDHRTLRLLVAIRKPKDLEIEDQFDNEVDPTEAPRSERHRIASELETVTRKVEANFDVPPVWLHPFRVFLLALRKKNWKPTDES